MAMKATKEVGCTLQFCMGLVQARVAVGVLLGPEATLAVPT